APARHHDRRRIVAEVITRAEELALPLDEALPRLHVAAHDLDEVPLHHRHVRAIVRTGCGICRWYHARPLVAARAQRDHTQTCGDHVTSNTPRSHIFYPCDISKEYDIPYVIA